MNGKGTFIWPDKRRFEGNYKNGKKHGKGVFYWPDGNKCEGEWEEGAQKEVNFIGDFSSQIPDENKDGLSAKNYSLDKRVSVKNYK